MTGMLRAGLDVTGAAITTVDGRPNNNPGNFAPAGSWPAVPPTAPLQVLILSAETLMTVYVNTVAQQGINNLVRRLPGKHKAHACMWLYIPTQIFMQPSHRSKQAL